MLVPVWIRSDELEELCYYEPDSPRRVACDDFDREISVDPRDADLDRWDLEAIVDKHLDTIIDILLCDRRYKEALLKKLSQKEGEENDS